MSGVVAIVGHSPDVRVDGPELERLANAYGELRAGGHSPAGERDRLRAGEHVAVIKIGPARREDTERGLDGIDSEGSSWAVSTGLAHRAGRLLATPVEELDGQFGLISFDAAREETTVASDPLGMHALYVAHRGDRTYVSDSSLALARHLRARPNRLALQVFLLSGYHFGTLTHWEGIERLDPGTCIRFGEAGLRRDRYWHPEIDDYTARLGFQGAVDHCIEVTVESFRARLASLPHAWLDLTGGYDSRLLSLLLRRAGVCFDTNTRDTPMAEDIDIAQRIAQVAGWRWHRPALPDEWPELLPTLLRGSLAWGDANLEVLQLSRVLWAHAQLSRTHASLLSGGGGEHFQYYAWQTEFAAAGRSSKVSYDNWLSMRMLAPIEPSILAGDPIPEVRANLKERMTAWAEPYSAELNTTQLDVLYAYKSTGHFGAYRSADGAFARAELPFYLKPVFTAAFSTAYRHRNRHRLMRHMIERLDPRIAALPTSKGGPAQPSRVTNLHRFAPYFLLLGRKALNKVTERSLGRPLMPLARSFPWTHAANRALLRSLRAQGGLRVEDMRSGSLFEPRALHAFLASADQPGFAGTTMLGRVITIELALKEVGSSLD